MTGGLKAKLAERLAAGKVLVVVGTGVSLASTGGETLASWKGLIVNGIERCAALGLRDAEWVASQKNLLEGDLDDLLGVAEQVSRRLGWKPTEPCDGNWSGWLRGTVGGLRARHPELIRAIRDLGTPIATLNYDNLLTDVTDLRSITWQRPESWLPVLQGDDQAILHLHGHWHQPSSVVLGMRSYEAVLGQDLAQHLQRALTSLMSLVFIGCSATLEDPNFSTLLTWMRGQLAGAEHSHYLLIRDGEPLPLAAPLLRQARVVPLHYGTAHADLLPFIRDLAPKPPNKSSGASSAGGDGHTVHPASNHDDDEPPTPQPRETIRMFTEAQEKKAIKALRQCPLFFRALQEGSLFKKFCTRGQPPTAAEDMVRMFARCPAERAQYAILHVRKALNDSGSQPLEKSDREAAEHAAACLYCLAVARLITDEERDAIVSRSEAGDYMVAVPTDANIVCAIIAMAVSGGELDLVPGTDKLPQAEFVFDVKAPESSEDKLEADFALAVCVAINEKDERAPQISLDRGSDQILQGDSLMSALEARFETYRDVRNKTVGVVVQGLEPAQVQKFAKACQRFARDHKVPIMVPDTQTSQRLLGMEVLKLVDRIAEFWGELTILPRRATRQHPESAKLKTSVVGSHAMSSPGQTFNIGTLSGGLTVGGGEGSVTQSGSGHIANIENRLGADLEPVLGQLAGEIGKLASSEKKEELSTELKKAQAEATKAKPDPSIIEGAVKKIELSASGIEAGGKIIGFCNKAYNLIGPYLGLPPSPLP